MLLLGRRASNLTRGSDTSARKVTRGSSRGPLVCALLATEGSPEEAAAEALDAVTRGFCMLKLKVRGLRNPRRFNSCKASRNQMCRHRLGVCTRLPLFLLMSALRQCQKLSPAHRRASKPLPKYSTTDGLPFKVRMLGAGALHSSRRIF